ncbi:hypothetical protein [Haladaptatus sp. CMSO5]|uniref:hypothetical protein n=1 Tax=Haladaptatus sp. CMSO5 TaxID=3120514 RepID=UPI002FCDE5F9
MVSRETVITALFVVIALPIAYLAQVLLESINVGEQTAFIIAFLVLIGVGVVLPQFLTSRSQ